MTANANFFEEQAEYLEKDQLLRWTVNHPKSNEILKKLKGPGNKLLSGPRGSGKTTMIMQAYYGLADDKKSFVIPAYVNYKKSLSIEPLLSSQSNSVFLFRQWVLHNILSGLKIGIIDKQIKPTPTFERISSFSQELIHSLEASSSKYLNSFPDDFILTPELLVELISKELDFNGMTRVVLFLDDAAHAFSRDQQREFFEIFRLIRSNKVSCKAAVYPGVTEYSPNFHVGHDADAVNIWYPPEDTDYLEFMLDIIRNRFPKETVDVLFLKPELSELLCFASFGLPRALIVMIARLFSDEGGDELESVSLTSSDVFRVISEWHQNTMSIFQSLQRKLPRYKNFIEVGEEAFNKSISLIKNYNSERAISSKSVSIGIKRQIEPELTRILGLLQYSGLLSERGTRSQGDVGIYERYVIHYAALIDSNALFKAKSKNPANIVEALKQRKVVEITRTTSKDLLGPDYRTRCVFLLPPCSNCGEPRITEGAQFCIKCGASLTSVSTYTEAENSPISDLPLTPVRVKRIQDASSIRTVKDIILDHEHQELIKVPRIGPYWADKIFRLAEEHLS